jgi:hypothetical protein
MLQDMLFSRTPPVGGESVNFLPGPTDRSRSSTRNKLRNASRLAQQDQLAMSKKPERKPGNSFFSKDAFKSTSSKPERRPRTRSASPEHDTTQASKKASKDSPGDHARGHTVAKHPTSPRRHASKPTLDPDADDERLKPVQDIADNLRKLRKETERPPPLPPKPVEYQTVAGEVDSKHADISNELLEQFAQMCAIHGDQLIVPDPADLAAVERTPPLFSGRPLHIAPSAPEPLHVAPPVTEEIVFPNCDELLATVEDHDFRMSIGARSILHAPKTDPDNTVRHWLKQVLVYDESGIIDLFDLVLANTSRHLQSALKAPKPIGPHQFEALCYDVFPDIRQQNTSSHVKAIQAVRGLRWSKLKSGTKSPPAWATSGWIPGLADQLEKIMEVTPRMQARMYLRMAFEEVPQSAVAQMKVWKNFKAPVERNGKQLLAEEKFWVSQS